MRYIEIVASVPVADAERAADIMREVTEGGVWIETPFSQHDLESDATIAADGAFVVHAYIPGDADRGGAVLDAKQRLTEAGINTEIEARIVAAEDWAEAWKEHFHVERYGDRIVVVPSWREYAAKDGDVVLTLDPGMAFGTGQHETTRMCLEALEHAVEPGSRLLDVGCGSGILSVAASKLGARDVWAVDVDPICVKVTTENADVNGVTLRVGRGSMGAAWPFEVAADARFDVVVANIIARAIVEMAGDLAGALTVGGRLIVSGVIAEREGEVVHALEEQGLRVESVRAMGEWRCIEAVKA
ncbi:MAG: 50S ribosomal protein L11 methyltransferase [Chloroflexi bacterium]|nr:50S ribosomal protein L11 methyltransferase [Chloroflexota bacterium]